MFKIKIVRQKGSHYQKLGFDSCIILVIDWIISKGALNFFIEEIILNRRCMVIQSDFKKMLGSDISQLQDL